MRQNAALCGNELKDMSGDKENLQHYQTYSKVICPSFIGPFLTLY